MQDAILPKRPGDGAVTSVEMLYYITMCQLTILYSFRLRLVSHLYSVDSPVCLFSSSIIIGFLTSDFITYKQSLSSQVRNAVTCTLLSTSEL